MGFFTIYFAVIGAIVTIEVLHEGLRFFIMRRLAHQYSNVENLPLEPGEDFGKLLGDMQAEQEQSGHYL